MLFEPNVRPPLVVKKSRFERQENLHALTGMLKSVTKRLKPLITAKLNEEYLAISNESNLYCLNYIEARFKRRNIESGLEFVRPDYVSETSTLVSIKIIEVGALLENAYPHLYTNVSKHLRVRLRSEVIINEVFKTFGRELFRDGATWAKITALFAFAASMSEDCVIQGRQELVKSILNCVRMYIHDHLAVWIRNQGGWPQIIVTFKCIERKRSTYFYLIHYIKSTMSSLTNTARQKINSTLQALYEVFELINFG